MARFEAGVDPPMLNHQIDELRRLYNRARILGHMLAIRALRRPRYPFYVNLVINTHCSLRCGYCFGRYPDRPQQAITFARFRKLVDELHAAGTRYILLQGGEPLLHPELRVMLAYLQRKKIVHAIVSNGQHPTMLAACPELAGMDNICFSLDGNADGNDLVRGKGAHAAVLRSITECRRLYSLPIRISSTVHRLVIDDAPYLADLAQREELEWGISFLFHGDEQCGEIPLRPDDTQIRGYLDQVLEYKRRGYPIFTSTPVLAYCRHWPQPYKAIYLSPAQARELPAFRPIVCQYGHYEIVIDVDERVYPCQAMQGIFPARRIGEKGFAAAFAHLATKPCATCYIPPLINTSAMINWHFPVIAETVRSTFRRRWRRTEPFA